MPHVDYFAIIHKFIPPDSYTYRLYLPHVAAVTAMSIRIARRLGLDEAQLQFIEEAAMLHDIGIVEVKSEWLHCTGTLPYIGHMEAGRKILEAEGLPRHARVAAEHIGVGITREEILALGLPLEPRDIFPATVEEQIISWSDLFFSKVPGSVWYQRSVAEARDLVVRFGDRAVCTFAAWLEKFGV
ncbi:MAG: HD domain-containing protein [Anaerolineae bacterium]|nr:HD domain-containing protein [Anaerolineae bacterium]